MPPMAVRASPVSAAVEAQPLIPAELLLRLAMLPTMPPRQLVLPLAALTVARKSVEQFRI